MEIDTIGIDLSKTVFHLVGLHKMPNPAFRAGFGMIIAPMQKLRGKATAESTLRLFGQICVIGIFLA
jgi:hypothetical protein